MAVNLIAPDPQSLAAVRGVALGTTAAGIRKPNRQDMLVIDLADNAQVAGVFTQNKFCAAPVIVAREHLADPSNLVRALVINTGNANAGTGAQGIAHARQ